MNRTESKAQFDSIFAIIVGVVGDDSWSGSVSWLDRTPSSGTPLRTQYDFGATRRVPLEDGPEQAMMRVRNALRDAGYDVRIQHDRAAGITAIGYPNGFNGGSASDGSGWEVLAQESGVSFGGNGHCVSGDLPDLDSPLNRVPSPATE
jgi:hypothetical protein